MRSRKLTKSNDNEVIFGVLGGIGEYFGIDPILLRIGVVLLFFSNNIPISVVYIIAAVVIPDPSSSDKFEHESKGNQGSKDCHRGTYNDRMKGDDEDDWSDF